MTITAPWDLTYRPDEVRLRELGEDIAALWSTDRADVAAWMCRPSILRRVASEFAGRLEPDTDRIVALGPGAPVLGSALSLATGLPFCAVSPDGSVFGEHHPGENVAVISVDAESDDPDWFTTLDVSRRLTVVRARHGAANVVLISLDLNLKGHDHD